MKQSLSQAGQKGGVKMTVKIYCQGCCGEYTEEGAQDPEKHPCVSVPGSMGSIEWRLNQSVYALMGIAVIVIVALLWIL